MIESTAINPEEKITFPCLMHNPKNGIIILFQAREIGTVVCCSDPRGTAHVGYHSESWDRTAFVPFSGTVTLKNS